MIIPKKEGCCDDQLILQQQQAQLPCCENLMAIYPPGRRSPRYRRRRYRRSPWGPRRSPWGPRGCTDKIIKVPVPITKVKYLDPIRVPDLILPPMPPPPPRRPRQMMMMPGNMGNMMGGNYCNCRPERNHPHYECVCKKC